MGGDMFGFGRERGFGCGFGFAFGGCEGGCGCDDGRRGRRDCDDRFKCRSRERDCDC